MSYTIYDMLAQFPVEELRHIQDFIKGMIEEKIKDMEEQEQSA